MRKKISRTAAVAIAGLAVAGGGAALAAAPGHDREAFLDDVAKRLGVDREALEQALEDSAVARVDAAVADGRLTEEQAKRVKERIRSGEGPLLGVPRFGPHGLGTYGGRGVQLELAAAEYLGLSEAELREARREGASLADLAAREGKALEGLKRALRAAAKAELDGAVEDGDLTAAERDERLQALDGRLDEIVRAQAPRFGGPRGHRGLHGAPWGPPAAA